LTYRVNAGIASDIESHLLACDDQYVPPLSMRLSIPDYSAKLFACADRFEAWSDSELVGLVAGYMNAANRQTSHISNVSVVADWQGKGLAATLIKLFNEQAQDRGFSLVKLEVNANNQQAIRLYERLGFRSDSMQGPVREMILCLRSKNEK